MFVFKVEKLYRLYLCVCVTLFYYISIISVFNAYTYLKYKDLLANYNPALHCDPANCDTVTCDTVTPCSCIDNIYSNVSSLTNTTQRYGTYKYVPLKYYYINFGDSVKNYTHVL